MEEYIGLDVSMKETAVSIRRAGERIWRGKCASDPSLIAELIRKRAPAVKRVVFETGPLSVWFYHSLRTEGLPAICIDARHAKAALDMAANKTDANDADGLAQLAEVGFFRAVRVKGFDSMLTRTLVAARTRLVRITTELSNQIRGVMKTFGLLVPAGKGSTFEKNVRSLLADQDGLASVVLPMLEAWRGIRIRAAELGRQLVRDARQSQACRILMSIPGIGAITATSFTTAIEEPDNFRKSRSVGAWIGLTTTAINPEKSIMTAIYPTWRPPFASASVRSRGRHSDAQLNRQYSAHVGSAAPGEDRLQKSCGGGGAQTGGYNAYNA
jgi:transposase